MPCRGRGSTNRWANDRRLKDDEEAVEVINNNSSRKNYDGVLFDAVGESERDDNEGVNVGKGQAFGVLSTSVVNHQHTAATDKTSP